MMLILLTLLFLCNCCVKAEEEQPEKVRIIVVGAGPSGIATATRLWQKGFRNILILEAEDRIGGRIHSVKFGDAHLDLGAEWCHGEELNTVYKLAKDLNILKHLNISQKFVSSKGEYIDQELSRDILKVAKDVDASEMSPTYAETCQNITSTGQCVKKNFDWALVAKYELDPEKSKIVEGSLDWLQAYIDGYDACLDWDDLYIKSTYQRCPGDLFLSWDGHGYKTILDVMLGRYPNPENELPIEIALNSEVVAISDWNTENKSRVRIRNGTVFEADLVVFTPSAGVLKASHRTLFEPNLPSHKIEAIEAVGFGAILKIIARFSEKWWDDRVAWYNIWRKEDREEMKEKCSSCLTKDGKLWLTYAAGWEPHQDNPKVITGWFAGAAIPEIEKLQDDDVIEGVTYAFNKFFGKIFNVTRPVEIIKTSWYSNPHFRGTYSYESASGHEKNTRDIISTLRQPLGVTEAQPSLFFAGEATHPFYFSTVHGAIDTGYYAASEIEDRIKDLSKPDR